MEASRDVAEYLNGRTLHPLEIMGSPLQPAVLATFTKFEIEEACRFLSRMGILSPRSSAASN
jgi:hypothetical protein